MGVAPAGVSASLRRMPGPESSPPGGPASAFATTQWSLILHAARPDSPEGARALASLCATYWYPLYAFVRRQGRSALDAQDLTLEFFARLKGGTRCLHRVLNRTFSNQPVGDPASRKASAVAKAMADTTVGTATGSTAH
mgnify:CR=1 FL=1